MSELNADNFESGVTDDGQIIAEPGYVGFLRSNGYTIESVEEIHTVASRSSEGSHIVVKITTYDKPKNHPELDIATDDISMWVCDCWAWRNSSADVSESGVSPVDCGSCPHVETVDKTIRAQNDDSQDTLL